LITIQIDGQEHQVLVDSGASLSILKQGVSSAEIFPTSQAAKGVTGNLLEIRGVQNIEFSIDKKKFCYDFVIAPLDVDYSGILGVDILRYMEARMDLKSNELVIGIL
jgi:predicted aspartyl protease